jgi:CheY-like chemotaxis protein
MIDVASELNNGSTFSIYLPAIEAREDEELGAPVSAPGRKGRILVMDDEEMLRAVAAEMIKALGHVVECARDGEDAIAKFMQARESGRPFDVVILDLTVKGGGMGGEHAVKKLREIDPNIKAVVSSGYADNPVVSDYQSYGFAAFLNKPYKIDSLRDSLNALLG